LESRNVKKKGRNNENQALVSHTRKNIIGGSPEPRRKKELTKVKCFACHEYGHYALECPQQKKGGRISRHQQQRLMRLQIGFRGSSYWSPPFQVQSLVMGHGWWIMEAHGI
jgi:hypothetical protein